MQGRKLIGLASLAVALAAPSGAGAAAIEYETGSGTVAPGEQSSYVSAICDPEDHVLSGGVFTTVGFAVVNVARPLDLFMEAGNKPDDGWTASVTNLSGIDATVRTYAICAKQQPRYASYESSVIGELSTGESCPGGSKATGAGVETTGGLEQTYIRTWMPYDPIFGKAREVRAVVKGSGAESPVTVYAVCSDDLALRYEFDKLKIPAGDGEQIYVKCRGGQHVVGGGGVQGTVGTGWELKTRISSPSDEGDADSKPDDSWRISVNNPSDEQRKIPVVAVCAA